MIIFYNLDSSVLNLTSLISRVWGFTFVIYVLLATARWFIFKKAGEKCWKALIPFYGRYISFKLFWNTGLFWASTALYAKIFLSEMILSLFTVVLFPAYLILAYSDVFTASILGAHASAIFIGAFIEMLAATVLYVFVHVRLMHKMSRSFGHGVPFTLGIIFLRPIFYFIMAFDKSVYTKIEE